jgi:histidinol-phosphate aminotransferase
LKRNRNSVVAVDEAYIDFGGQSAASLVPRYDNLLVIQTLSKSRSLAGMRLGLALGNAELLEGLIRVKDSFNSYPIDRLALAAGIAAFEDEDYFRHTCQQVIADRETLSDALQRMGFQVIPSAANFLFARHPGRQAVDLAAQLREASVIVRHFRKPRIDQYLRITVGTPEQNRQLIEALQPLL